MTKVFSIIGIFLWSMYIDLMMHLKEYLTANERFVWVNFLFCTEPKDSVTLYLFVCFPITDLNTFVCVLHELWAYHYAAVNQQQQMQLYIIQHSSTTLTVKRINQDFPFEVLIKCSNQLISYIQQITLLVFSFSINLD